ncbi:MAG: hypothetical protein M1824_001652 [Vezdaea acicularis]|nr:MAG: hypothetical protein M1824_001652 [Vezdaea acicularis]
MAPAATRSSNGTATGSKRKAESPSGVSKSRKTEPEKGQKTLDETLNNEPPKDEVQKQVDMDREEAVDEMNPDEVSNEEQRSKDNAEPSSSDNAVQETEERADAVPSSIIEKGLIYFFFRPRVGVDDPKGVNDIARSHIVLRPLPKATELTKGTVPDQQRVRMIALPKKVLPNSPNDRFTVFVEKANVSVSDLRDALSHEDYSTQTAGQRHIQAANPAGEGVYAITSTGRETHLAYILTVPSHPSEVQSSLGLRTRDSFVISLKNPAHKGPSYANLPEAPEFSKEIMEAFAGRRWMPPKSPDIFEYANAQFLLIGHSHDDEANLEKATQVQPEDQKEGKETPLEEMEKLEEEDELRIESLKGDEREAIFADLGLSKKEFEGIKTEW